jgi:hypothetical protein
MASSGKEHFKPADVEGLGQPARNIDPSDDSKAIGILLYKIEEKETSWSGKVEWTALEFYDNVIMCRKKLQWCCFPKTYYAEAIPRFKVVNVTFTNGRRNLFWWIFFLIMIGVLIIIFGMILLPSGIAKVVSIVGIVLLVLSPVPLVFCSKWRYVTFDIKGLNSGGWFSKDKIYSFNFCKSKPDEDFIVNYIYSPLRKGCAYIHALSHYNSAALAAPLKTELYTMMKAEDSLLPLIKNKDWVHYEDLRQRSDNDMQTRPHIAPPLQTYDEESEPYSVNHDLETPEDAPTARIEQYDGTDIYPVRAQRLPQCHS